jgi:hypothetical protein
MKQMVVVCDRTASRLERQVPGAYYITRSEQQRYSETPHGWLDMVPRRHAFSPALARRHRFALLHTQTGAYFPENLTRYA